MSHRIPGGRYPRQIRLDANHYNNNNRSTRQLGGANGFESENAFMDVCRPLVATPPASGGDRYFETEQMEMDFTHRPSYVDAGLAVKQIDKGKAIGCRAPLIFRSWMQAFLFGLGCFIQTHAAKCLCVGVIFLSLFCIGLRSITIETNIEKLWVEKGGRLEEERNFLRETRDAAAGQVGQSSSGSDSTSASYQVVIQTPLKGQGTSILSTADLLAHVDIMMNITQMEVSLFGAKWRLDDICFKPDPPLLEGDFGRMINPLLEKIIPCVIITPLDCFWEGSKPLGPFPSITIPMAFQMNVLPQNMSWKNLNPEGILKILEEWGLLELEEFANVGSLFGRAGISTGFQAKPCLDPFDPECPKVTPNYRSTAEQNIGEILTGGCEGYASKLMFWPEDLIVGGIKRKNGLIASAEALESIMLVSTAMGIYKRFENGGKEGLSRHDWTLGSAETVLLAWQRNFSELLYNTDFNRNQMTRDSFIQQQLDRKTPLVPVDAASSRKSGSKNRTGGNRQRLSRSKKSRSDWATEKSKTQFSDLIHDDLSTLLRRKSSIVPMFHPLSGTSVNDLLTEFSKFKVEMIVTGYVLMVVYAAVTLVSCKGNGVESAVGLAAGGCLLVTAATAAGLGVSSVLGIQFNAATTQIVPFLTLGLGVDDMFLLVYNYQDTSKQTSKNQLGYLLKETGLSVVLTSVNNILAFLTGGFLPIPALRSFCHQVAILLFFNLVFVITLYPAMIAIDLKRRSAQRVDVFCCFRVRDKSAAVVSITIDADTKVVEVEDSPPPSYDAVVSVKSLDDSKLPETSGSPCASSSAATTNICKVFSLRYFVTEFYAPILMCLPVKVFILIVSLVVFGVGVIGLTHLKLGLELTDVVPKDTSPYDFLSARERYFSFYTMNAVVNGDYDYPYGQQLLNEYRNNLMKVKYMVHDSGTSTFWLSYMRDWLISLQERFNEDMLSGNIRPSGFQCHSDEFLAHDDSILAYKLMVNVRGNIDRSRIGRTQLVIDGVINPILFYNCLTAWYHMDSMTYYVSQANFKPLPWPEWEYEKGKCKDISDDDLKIPAAKPLISSQIPFFLKDLKNTSAIVEMITWMRSVSDDYVSRGLPNFPEGIPFTFWEQYISLKYNLLVCICIITVAVFVVISLLLMSPWTAAIIVSILVIMVIELAGLMGVLNLKLNPVSAVTLITAVGIGVEFTVHICFSYLTSLGTPNERLAATLDHMFIPVLHGGLSTLLGVIMLAFSEFEFIVKYFFLVMAALIVLGLFNGLMLLPVVLSLIGPKPEVFPVDESNYLPPPSPPPKPKLESVAQFSSLPPFVGGSRGRPHSSVSLSTIPEEPTPPSSTTPPGQNLTLFNPFQPQCLQRNGTTFTMSDQPVVFTVTADIQVQVRGAPNSVAPTNVAGEQVKRVGTKARLKKQEAEKTTCL